MKVFEAKTIKTHPHRDSPFCWETPLAYKALSDEEFIFLGLLKSIEKLGEEDSIISYKICTAHNNQGSLTIVETIIEGRYKFGYSFWIQSWITYRPKSIFTPTPVEDAPNLQQGLTSKYPLIRQYVKMRLKND